MSQYFLLNLNVEVDLSVEEIWPDGNAPENPTKEDVQKLLDEVGLDSLIKDWMLVGPWDRFIADGPYEYPGAK